MAPTASILSMQHLDFAADAHTGRKSGSQEGLRTSATSALYRWELGRASPVWIFV